MALSCTPVRRVHIVSSCSYYGLGLAGALNVGHSHADLLDVTFSSWASALNAHASPRAWLLAALPETAGELGVALTLCAVWLRRGVGRLTLFTPLPDTWLRGLLVPLAGSDGVRFLQVLPDRGAVQATASQLSRHWRPSGVDGVSPERHIGGRGAMYVSAVTHLTLWQVRGILPPSWVIRTLGETTPRGFLLWRARRASLPGVVSPHSLPRLRRGSYGALRRSTTQENK